MMKKYDRCSKCDKLLSVPKKKRTYKNVCESCVARELYNNNLVTPVVQEEWFEDDPRALKEIEYGRVSRSPTNVFSRTILDDIG
jgi:DNA-directed RNA polymerase subunit M/transcription elongation factor TFIIS